MESDHSQSSDGGCLGCLFGLLALFLIVFLINHWNQIDQRLAHLLGL